MKEPDYELSPVDREERRRCFWSIYLLDKLVSSGRDRHPAISDEACQICLPCDESAFRKRAVIQSLTLRQILDWEQDSNPGVGYFSLTILAGSILASCNRRVFHDREEDKIPPWDMSSDFASVIGALLMLESRLGIGQPSLSEIIHSTRTEAGSIDHQDVGHAILAHTILHLCYCLLNHPFLLRKQLSQSKHKPSSQFLYVAFQLGYRNAQSLSQVLMAAKKAGGFLNASFYAYAACVAGGVLLLNLQAEHSNVTSRALEMMNALQDILDILHEMGQFWDHAAKMVRLDRRLRRPRALVTTAHGRVGLS
jgi:hypothetical protein